MKKFEPTVIAFSCMFCAGCKPAEARPEKNKQAARLKIIRLHCLGKINSRHVLKAFESGADAVLVAGGACRFMEGMAAAQKQIDYTRKLLEELGIEPQRLELAAVSRTEGSTFTEAAEEIAKRVRAMGPNPLRQAKKAA